MYYSWARFLVVLVAPSFLLLASCGKGPDAQAEAPPNVLILLIDALRADHLSCYGYERKTSPHIDALALESLRFENAFAQSPWTKPSIPTLFTSLYPIQHRVYEGERMRSTGQRESDVLSEECFTLAESMREAGYETVGFVNNAHLLASQGLAQGFDRYEQDNYDANQIHQMFYRFLDERSSREPFFAYLHYLDVHWPFCPVAPFDEKFPSPAGARGFSDEEWKGLRERINEGEESLTDADRQRMIDLHDGGISELDDKIGQLLSSLRKMGLLENTLIVLTSDHGEELFDHGEVGHGGTLFEEVVRVPFLVRLPGGKGARVSQKTARLLDVFPTVAHFSHARPPAAGIGRNLLSEETKTPDIVAETRHKNTYKVSIREGNWKYIRVCKPHSGRSEVVSDSKGVFGLRPGVRVKVVLDPSFDRLAKKISVKDSSDQDLELSGTVASLLTGQSLEILGYSVRLDQLVKGRALLPELGVGSWIKVEGDLEAKNLVFADKLELLGEDDRMSEVEGIITKTEKTSSLSGNIWLGEMPIRVTEDTRVKGVDPDVHQRTNLTGVDPFSPENLASEEGLLIEEHLYCLSEDPGELTDRSESEGARMTHFREKLMGWLKEVSADRISRPSAPKELSAETFLRLESIGYH